MIMSVTQNGDLRGTIGYIIGDGKVPGKDDRDDVSRTVSYKYNPAKDAAILDYNLSWQVPGQETALSIIREMRSVRRNSIKSPVAHMYISWDPNDLATKNTATLRALTREALELYQPGLAKRYQYVAALHRAHSEKPHVHIAINRVPVVPRKKNMQGKVSRTPVLQMWRSRFRCLEVCDEMERKHLHLMRQLDRSREKPLDIKESSREYRMRQRLIAAGEPLPPWHRKRMFEAVQTVMRDSRAVSWKAVDTILAEQGIRIKLWTDSNSVPIGVRFIDTKDIREIKKDVMVPNQWEPKRIHSEYSFKAFERILSRHRTEAQLITVAAAKRRAEAFKELGLDPEKLDRDGMAAMRRESEEIRRAGEAAKQVELDASGSLGNDETEEVDRDETSTMSGPGMGM